jgi:hypothetical protein
MRLPACAGQSDARLLGFLVAFESESDAVAPSAAATSRLIRRMRRLLGFAWGSLVSTQTRSRARLCQCNHVIDGHAGIKVTLADGDDLTLPPNPDAFRDAMPGIYRLRSTGEEIVDPDLTTVWTIRESLDDRN